MPAAVKPAERVSLTYDERNGNYNSNKTPFLKIVLPKMEIFTAQCVGRCAGKWTPFGRCAEGAHVGAAPAVRQRLRGRARPGHFAPALPVLPVYRRAATCVKRRVDEGPRSLPDSSGERHPCVSWAWVRATAQPWCSTQWLFVMEVSEYSSVPWCRIL